MNINKPSIYSIAKNISYEILVEEQLQLQSKAINTLFERYNKKRISLKLKFLSYKIINGIIFALLPLFPIIAYLDITTSLTNLDAHVQIIMLIQSLVLQTFIILQFFDFLLMGVFNLVNIMSGEIFEWFKTLPFSRKELKRLALLTIFHNFDIAIIANLFAFPIMIFIVTQNVFVLLISLGCSALNIMFSISILIILGQKIGKLIKERNKKVKRSLIFQFLNAFSYVIIIFGSIFAAQIILSSMITFIISSADLSFSPLYNLILSFISFPFSPVYLIIYIIHIPEMIINFWLSPLFGMALYAIYIYFFIRKAMKSINEILSLKQNLNDSMLLDKDYILRIHRTSPIKAFIRKDLLIASRNLQTFMYFIMPIIMSFVFIIFFNISYAGAGALLGGDLFYNWIVMVGFSPIISGTIVYNILSIESTGKTITGALPIVIRDQAKAKLGIMILIQVIALLAPSLIYLLNSRFIDLLITSLAALPFTLIFLLLIFIQRVLFFGKRKSKYVLDEIAPKNKMSKWIFIFFINYFLYILLVSIIYFLYFSFDFFILLLNLIIIILILIVVVKGLFDILFPKFKIDVNLKKQTRQKLKVVKWPIIITSIVIIYYLISILFLVGPTFILFNPQLSTGLFLIIIAIIMVILSLTIPKKRRGK
ncbi:MAG: hypothetical protein ACFFBH_06700 [Promethearchaeota archaeon]